MEKEFDENEKKVLNNKLNKYIKYFGYDLKI